MIKNICLWVLSLISYAVFGAASSQQPAAEQTARATGIPDFIRFVYGKSSPEISVICFEHETSGEGFFSNYRHDILGCVLIGHGRQEVREQVLDHVMQLMQHKKDKNFWKKDETDLVSSLQAKAWSEMSEAELAQSAPLLTAALFMHYKQNSIEAFEYRMLGDVDQADKLQEKKSDHALRSPAFYNSGHIAELLRRVDSGECPSSVIDEAFNDWAERTNTVGVEIQREGLRCYFNARAAANLKARI